MTLPLWSKETRPPLVHTPFVLMKKLSLRDSLLSITTIMLLKDKHAAQINCTADSYKDTYSKAAIPKSHSLYMNIIISSVVNEWQN